MMRNQSGYPDPTAEAAIGKAMADAYYAARRPMVYLCAPEDADRRWRTRRARQYCRMAVQAHTTPIMPRMMYERILGAEGLRENGTDVMFMSRTIMRKCRELWWFGDTPTREMKQEIRYANKYGLVIRHFTKQGTEVKRHAVS